MSENINNFADVLLRIMDGINGLTEKVPEPASGQRSLLQKRAFISARFFLLIDYFCPKFR